MNELDLIRELRDGSPDVAAREHARHALREHMDGSPPLPQRQGPRRRWLAVPAALAAVAAVVIALLTGVDGARIAPASAKAREALERAASAAEARPERLLAPGEYLYERERSAYLADMGSGWSVLVPRERETWTNREGDVRFSEREVGRAILPGPRDRRRWHEEGRPDLSPNRTPEVERLNEQGFGAGASTLTYEEMQSLPGDGQAMYRRLVKLAGAAGSSPDEEAFTIIGDLLRAAPVPAQARAGLYRAAAYIKGVRYAGEVRDELGRRGLAVDLEDEGERRRLVFDPDTSQLLVEQQVVTERTPGLDAGPGFVAGYRLLLEQGIVKSDRARP